MSCHPQENEQNTKSTINTPSQGSLYFQMVINSSARLT